MQLFTVQTKQAYEAMMKNGVLRIGENEASYTMAARYKEIFEEPYAYITERMRRYIKEAPKGCVYPIWAWYKYANRRAPMKPRLYEEYGEQMLITFRVPGKSVLLSDFNLYEAYALHSLPMLRDAELEAYLNWQQEKGSEKEAQHLLALIKDASWERMFMPYADKALAVSKSYIQATVWEIKREQIVSAELLKG